MSENASSNTLKKSFFGDYFRYKLRTLRGFIISFGVMNFLSTVCLVAALMIFVKAYLIPMHEADIGGYNLGPLALMELYMYLVIAVIFVEMLMLMILPAVNFKIFNKRSTIDTIGGLPLTGSQRFLGDMLSGAAAFGISFIPCSVISIILAAITESGPIHELYVIATQKGDNSDYIFPWGSKGFLEVVIICLLTLLICYAAAYAISCFVSSCCGKVGTSVLFSVIMIIAFTAITFSFGGYIFDNAKGFDSDYSNMTLLSVIPPAGTLISTATILSDSGTFILMTPLVLIPILFIVLFGVGSYFAAMRRKPERVGREVVFGAGYYVIPAIITVMGVGFVLPIVEFGMSALYVPLFLVALGVCLVMAYLQSHSFKKIWKGAAVFVATTAACLGLGLLIYKTQGLGISYIIPSKQSIESVELSGVQISNKFYGFEDFNGYAKIESDEGISLVLSEHQKILDDLDNYASKVINGGGDPMTFFYHLKNGLTSVRRYQYIGQMESKYDDPLTKFADEVGELPELCNMTAFGVLGNPEMPCISIIYSGRNPTNTANEAVSNMSLIIKPSAYDKFIECYLDGLLNWTPSEVNKWLGSFEYQYIDRSGNTKTYSDLLWLSYDKVVEFLSDPNNFDEADLTIDDTKEYRVYFRDITLDDINDGSSSFDSISFTISHPELAREFFAYVEAADDLDEDKYSQRFIIRDFQGFNYRVTKENEQAALSAFIKAIRAHRAIGGSDND